MRIRRKFWFLKQGKACMQNLFPGTRGLMWQVQLRSDAPLIFDDCPFHFACFVYLKPLKQRELSRHSGKEIKLRERLKLSMLFLLLSSSKVFSCNPWGVLIWFLSELHKIHKLLKCIIVYILEHSFLVSGTSITCHKWPLWRASMWMLFSHWWFHNGGKGEHRSVRVSTVKSQVCSHLQRLPNWFWDFLLFL